MFKRILFTTTQYIIIDDDFKEICSEPTNWLSIVDKIINIYEGRKIDPAKNIILFFIFYSQYGWSIKEQFNLFIKYAKNSNKYKDDLEKYLLLL